MYTFLFSFSLSVGALSPPHLDFFDLFLFLGEYHHCPTLHVLLQLPLLWRSFAQGNVMKRLLDAHRWSSYVEVRVRVPRVLFSFVTRGYCFAHALYHFYQIFQILVIYQLFTD